jgi:YfiR/HmsC-like
VALLSGRPVVVAFAVGLATAAARAQSDAPVRTPPTEYEVKAAFLYNFARFVEWPPETFHDAQEPFVIAVLGRDPFGPALDDTVSGKTVLGRRIEVRRATRAEDIHEAQIVFVSASERAGMPAILKTLERPGLLTVGDVDGFAEHGGAINFIMQGHKVRFEINPTKAEQARLKMSSQLLKLATLVAGPRS